MAREGKHLRAVNRMIAAERARSLRRLKKGGGHESECLDPRHGHIERCPNCGFQPGGGRESGGGPHVSVPVAESASAMSTAAANPAVPDDPDGTPRWWRIEVEPRIERIRALEADLDRRANDWKQARDDWERERARAEKAEARVAELEIGLIQWHAFTCGNKESWMQCENCQAML